MIVLSASWSSEQPLHMCTQPVNSTGKAGSRCLAGHGPECRPGNLSCISDLDQHTLVQVTLSL